MTRTILIGTALMALAGSAAAQDALTRDQQRLAEGRRSPGLDARTGFAGSGVVLAADSDASAASFSLAQNWDGPSGIDFNTVSVRFSAPLNDDKTAASFITDDGFVGETSIELSYASVRGKEFKLPLTMAERRALLVGARAACAAQALTEAARQICRGAAWTEVRRHLDSQEAAAADDTEYARAPIWASGFTAAIGYDEYDHRDPATFAEKATDRTSYSASAYVGYSPDSRPLYFAGGLEYKIDYKAVDDRTLCPPAPPGGVAECFTGAFAGPVRDVNETVFAVGRGQFELGLGGFRFPAAVQAKAAYDFEDDVLGMSGALYVVPDAAGGLRGGLKVSWSDEEDEVKVGLFVSSAFSLF